ncbi:MAG: ABC transporter permease [Acidimicrobiales bacterium]
MIGFVIRRLLQAVLVVLGVILIMFLLIHVIPGGEARAVLGPRAGRLQIHNFELQNGLLLPLWDQFFHYVGHLATFHLGRAPTYNEPVLTLIANRLPKTLLLVGISTVFALIVAVPLGIFQVVRRYKPEDYILTGLSFVGYAAPAFFIGALLISWFAIDLHIFSAEAPQGQGILSILGDPRGLVLPVLTLAALTIASFSRYMRSSMMETMTEDFIRTARAKGAQPRRVLYVHALRNAIIPVVTLLGLNLGYIVSGAVITESVFNYPGMGLLTVQAAFRLDVPTILGATYVITVATVLGNLIADILYAVVDPRIRYA